MGDGGGCSYKQVTPGGVYRVDNRPGILIKELDCVALAADRPDHWLAVSDVGAVVHGDAGGHIYQVEFTTYEARTAAVAKVSADQTCPLGSKEAHHPRAFAPGVR